jgi:hypothetical protein
LCVRLVNGHRRRRRTARESNAAELDKLRNEITSLTLSIKNFEELKLKNEQAKQ